MKNDKTLGLVITDGVSFRNFILTEFLNLAAKRFKKVIIYSYVPNIEIFIDSENVFIVKFPFIKEAKLVWFFRRIKEISHLRLNREKNYGINDNYLLNTKFIFSKRGLLNLLVKTLASFFTSELTIHFWTRLQYYFIKKNRFELFESIKSDSCDLVFFSHQRPSFIAPLISVFTDLKIKIGTFIFSWDNIPSKGRMAGDFNFYFVWSDLMKDNLKLFYPSIRDSNIFTIGTTQFDFYYNKNFTIPKKEFLITYEIPSDSKIILFSGGDITTSPNDEIYIEFIYESILNGLLPKNTVLIVRTSPAESNSRFIPLINKINSNHVRWVFPQWSEVSDLDIPEKWALRIPDIRDLVIMRSLLEHCDVNVNMCSTMSLDALHFSKPVINVVFGNSVNGLFNDQKFLLYEHYEYVVASGVVKVAKTREDLVKYLNSIFMGESICEIKKKSLMNSLIYNYGSPSASNFVDTLIKVCE